MTAQIPRVVHYEPTYHPATRSVRRDQFGDKRHAIVLRDYFYDNGTQPILFVNGTHPDVPLFCPTSSCTWPSSYLKDLELGYAQAHIQAAQEDSGQAWSICLDQDRFRAQEDLDQAFH